jgi:glycosyltransferase involved in cell wall biosynthesis
MVRELLPRLEARLGEGIRLVIAGRHDAFTCPGLDHPAIELKGMVNELRPLFERARVFLAPTWFGAGIPIKVQWAAALGVPVVASPLIATQLGWQAGIELSVADSAEAFADSCCVLHRGEDVWQRQRAAALARVASECSRDVFRRTLEQCLARPQMPLDDDRISGVGPANVRTSKY